MTDEIQQTFNKVIEAKIYPTSKGMGMCIALNKAMTCGLITRLERDAAVQQINEYMIKLVVLAGYASDECDCCLKDNLAYAKLPNSSKDMLAIYKNWAERPYELSE